MTQTLPAGTAPPPTLPVVVLVEARRGRDVLHAADARHVRTGGFLATALAMTHVTHRWCPTCWPDGRCGICQAPSGAWSECATCAAAHIAAEIRYDRAVEHCEETSS